MTNREKLQLRESETRETLCQAQKNMNVMLDRTRENEHRARQILSNRDLSACEELVQLVAIALEQRKKAQKARQDFEEARLQYSNALWRHWRYLLATMVQR